MCRYSVTVEEVRTDCKFPTILCHKADNQPVQFPWFCLYNFAEIDKDSLDEKGFPKIGSTLYLIEKGEERYYPDPQKYKLRRPPLRSKSQKCKMSEESLREGLVKYNPLTLDELWSLVYQKVGTMSPDDVGEAFSIKLLPDNLQYDELCKLLGYDKRISLPIQEGIETEFKSSFVYTALYSQKDRMKQYHKIYNTICGMLNSDLHQGRIFVGVTDDGQVRDLTSELINNIGFRTRTDMENDFRNILGMYIKNDSLAQSIHFTWCEDRDGKIFCVIDIPKYSGPIVYAGAEQELYVRFGSSTKKLTGPDLVAYANKAFQANFEQI